VLIIALVLAVIGLAALVTAVVTSNEVIAWVCIGASVIGVLLLIIDALRERSRGTDGADSDDADEQTAVLAASEPAEDYPDEPTSQFPVAGDDTDTTSYSSYPNDTSYPDETDYPDEASRSDETEAFEPSTVDDVRADESSDADEPTKRD
jgi:hypothetical protein